jgi:hypothetical protein
MDHEPSSSEYAVAWAVFKGITNDFSIVERLARFVSNNAASLKSLGMDADAPGDNIQETWLNACIVESEEDLCRPGAKFFAILVSLSEGFEQNEPRHPSQTVLAFESINPVLCQVILLFAERDESLELAMGDKSHMSKDWFNCVFNADGSKGAPIVLEVDVSHHATGQLFHQEFSEHIVDHETFAIAVGSPKVRNSGRGLQH